MKAPRKHNFNKNSIIQKDNIQSMTQTHKMKHKNNPTDTNPEY